MDGQKGTRLRVTQPEGGKVMVKQAMRDEVDASRIMEKWIKLGQFPRGAPGQPMYGDFTSGQDYHGALSRVRQIEEEFMALPSRVRTRCRNDPGEFLQLCSDPKNLEELRELGLAEQDVPDQVVKVKVVEDPERSGEGARGAFVLDPEERGGSRESGREAPSSAPARGSKDRKGS